MDIDKEIIHQLRQANANFFTTYPCAKIQRLLALVHEEFLSVTVTKEEEGVGICAGASLVGSNPAMLIQSTGLGNMINALCSLTLTYQLPLLVLASWRGVYKETIPAQIRLGKALPGILQSLDCHFHTLKTPEEVSNIGTAAKKAFKENSLQVVLLSPQLWEATPLRKFTQKVQRSVAHKRIATKIPAYESGSLTRYKILELIAPEIRNKLVICNMGMPSRELYQICHQPSNFYMLGSLGLASSIGLGVALHTSKPVVVIDGDGSLLSNLGSLATIGSMDPTNLTIYAIDNGVHGSTGNQPTATNICVDLARTAQSQGIHNVFRCSTSDQLKSILSKLSTGPNFIHILSQPGNATVPIIPMTPPEIKNRFMKAVQPSRTIT